MKSFDFEDVEVGFKVVIAPVIAGHFNCMSQLLKMSDHLAGPGRVPGSLTRYAVYDFGQDRLLEIFLILDNSIDSQCQKLTIFIFWPGIRFLVS
jgi:hypothetical protein